MIVVDASLLLDALLGSAPAVARLVSDDLAAPDVVDLEVVSGLRRLVARGHVPDEAAAAVVTTLGGMELRRFASRELVGRVWELRSAVAPFDATYVALAEALDATLVTLDGPLSRSSGHRARVELLA